MKEANKAILNKLLGGYLVEMEERYSDAAKSRIAFWIAKMEAADWDLNVVAPFPSRFATKEAYRAQMNDRNYIESITNYVHQPVNFDEKAQKDLRKNNLEAQAKIIESSKEEAKVSLDGYITKLISKIDAEIVDAKLSGILWTGCILTITTASGEVQEWKTKMILNQSKYHVIFNQFPTRKVG